MKNHEKAFSEIKHYYNDITLNNLALINSLKEQVEEMRKKYFLPQRGGAPGASLIENCSSPAQDAAQPWLIYPHRIL